jgi:uncharacterized protein GlcG (DUF336 family)
MSMVTLAKSRRIVSAALKKAQELGLGKPMSVVVLDARGAVKAFESQDGSSTLRFNIAFGKANGAIALGIGSRAIFERAQQQPYFVQSVNALANGNLVPVPGASLSAIARARSSVRLASLVIPRTMMKSVPLRALKLPGSRL